MSETAVKRVNVDGQEITKCFIGVYFIEPPADEYDNPARCTANRKK